MLNVHEAGSGLSHDKHRPHCDFTGLTQMLLPKGDSQVGGQQLHLLKSENTLKMIQSVKNLHGSVCP